MSWHYLRVEGEESLQDICLGGEQLPPLKSKITHAEFYCNGKLMDSYLDSLSGTTFAPLMENLGQEKSMLSQEDSHAKTLAQQEKAQVLMEKGLDSGEKWQGSFAKYDPNSCSWKTHQYSLVGDLTEFSETWPKWGLMRNGECWEQTALDCPIVENEFGCWLPTPVSSLTNGAAKKRYFGSREYRASFTQEWIRTSMDCGQYLNPVYVELAMDFPDKWTDLKPLEMHKFQEWQQTPGES